MADTVEPEPPPPPPEEVTITQPVTVIPSNATPPRQGCMGKRSRLEKVLLVLVIFVLIICLGFVAAFIIFYFFATPPVVTCLTENCVRSASRLKEKMNEKVNPCDDFYEYACGGWLKKQELKPHETKIDLASTINDGNSVKIKGLLEMKNEAKDPAYKKLPRLFYSRCMDLNRLNVRGAEPFLKLVESIGKFPSLDSTWNETDFKLEDILIKLARHRLMPLVTLYVHRDIKNVDKNKIYITDASLTLSNKASYQEGRNDQRVKSYEKWFIDTLVQLDVDKQDAETDAKDVVDFEIKLAKLMRSDVDKTDQESTYNSMSVATLLGKYTWLNWLELLQGLASPYSIFIGNEEIIINMEPAYLEKLGEVLKNTPKRVQANYLMSKLLGFTELLSTNFTLLYDQLIAATLKTQPRPRWEKCVEEATALFPDAISRMYIDNFFSKEAKEYLSTMISDLTEAFKELLHENTWMTKETKKKAEDKLNAIGSKIGYPDYILDDVQLNTLYSNIFSKETEYFETNTAYLNNAAENNIKKLREPKDKSKWPVPAITVNANYDTLNNEIIFPAAFLQLPLYSQDFSSSEGYGTVGSMYGRLLTKGFYGNGSHYDKDGVYRDWWTDEDKANFKSRSQCFVDQYGCYSWDGHSVNGITTLGENIADNGGLKQSYRAYRNFVKRQGSEENRLPGLDLNHNQIFFLSFAQVWCAKYRDEVKKEVVETDIHSPSKFRVFGTLRNSKEFAEAFMCKPGSRMVTLDKCVLW
ncbi:neprilysin-like isoform X2 [Physella acuta]|uniref:neprilysin-like isoform X2 n=1 Tax=Physella acuta TaxID=109671 RepID=UPI0027DB18EC|nr:neprilysin-like isoform X2 [Physella acuta]